MTSKRDFKILSVVILIILGQVSFVTPAHALASLHPIEMYEKGMQVLNSYHGDPATLSEAQKYFSDLMKKFPDSPYGYLGMTQVQKINAYLYSNRYNMNKVRDDVLPFAIKAIEMGPSVREVHENYANLERIYEDFYVNQKAAQQALLNFPDKAETYLVIGMFFADQDENDKAVEFYKTALSMTPSSAVRLQILERVGLLYLNQLKEPEKAIKPFEQALEIAPHSAIFNENMGMTYLAMKNPSKAISYLTKAIRTLNNSYTQYQLLQAQALQAEKEGKITEAIIFLEHALAVNKSNIALHFKLGNLQYGLGNYAKAYEHFMKVIDIEPQNTGAYYFAGRSAYSLGNTDTAISYYKRYLQLDADSEEAAWIRKNVPELSQK